MSPSRRIRTTIAKRAKLEDAAARAQVAILNDLRIDITRELATAQGFRLFRLRDMLSVVDSQMEQHRNAAEAAMAKSARVAYGLGQDMAGPVPGSLYSVSDPLLSAIVDVTRDQTRAVWRELGTGLKVQVRRVTLGLTDPMEAMASVAKLIQDPKTFGKAIVRAEAIVRTEVNRTFSMASNQRQAQADKALQATGERVMKYWLDAGDSRVRDAHAEAGERYTKDSPIPFDEPFIVDGEEMMHPHDPSASAANVANCRCIAPAVVVSAAKFEKLSKAA